MSSAVKLKAAAGGSVTMVVDDTLTTDEVVEISRGTISNFTSTGIDDNATSTAITIDANQRVSLECMLATATSLATTKTSAGLEVNTGGGTNALDVFNNGDGAMGIQVSNGPGTTAYPLSLNPYGGQVRVGTAGLTFNGDTSSANALDDYEEGTWNPTENNGVTLTDNETPRYTKVGDIVHLWFDVTVATNTNGNNFDLSGIPFTAKDMGCAGGAVYYCNMNNSLANAGLSFHFTSTTRASLKSGYDAGVLLADMSGHRISGVIIYKATA